VTAGARQNVRVGIVGGSGYTGGELLRLLLDHPNVTVEAITSRQRVGEPVHRAHPNLRRRTDLKFTAPDDIAALDVLFLCMPHGRSAPEIERWTALAPTVIDLSADFRLRDPAFYELWYGEAHPATGVLESAVYGLPELNRERLRGASLISGVGCNATAMILALKPLADAGLIERVIADVKVGSSEAGAEASAGSHHPERAGAVRHYAPAGHRHAAEVHQAFGEIALDVSVTAVEMVRGAVCTAHVIPTERRDAKALWKLYRAAYGDEPFVRIVRERGGLHRLPDAKILAGSNYADVGFDIDERSGRIVSICAIDNLMKGAAGTAVQSMNVALELDETAGLTFPGLHPI